MLITPYYANNGALEHHLEPHRCLFIGDAITDFDAAAATSLVFLGIVSPGESNPFPPHTIINQNVHHGIAHIAAAHAIKY